MKKDKLEYISMKDIDNTIKELKKCKQIKNNNVEDLIFIDILILNIKKFRKLFFYSRENLNVANNYIKILTKNKGAKNDTK